MALRIDLFNKKLAALNVELVKNEEEEYFYVIDTTTEDQLGEMIEVAKINHLTEEQWMAEINDRIAERDEESEEDEGEEEEDEAKMSGTLKKYRPTYIRTTSYNGNHSLDNGDDVAEQMRGMSPQEACALADKVFGEPEFFHWEKWQRLNPGSRRMNAGNRIRAAYKRGDFTLEELQGWAAGKDLVDDEADV